VGTDFGYPAGAALRAVHLGRNPESKRGVYGLINAKIHQQAFAFGIPAQMTAKVRAHPCSDPTISAIRGIRCNRVFSITWLTCVCVVGKNSSRQSKDLTVSSTNYTNGTQFV